MAEKCTHPPPHAPDHSMSAVLNNRGTLSIGKLNIED